MRSLILLLILTYNCLLAQKDTVAYTKDYKFKEGIYLNFKQFRNNQPILKSKLVEPGNPEDMHYIADAVLRKSVHYIDSNDNKDSISSDKIWGYSQNNALYIHFRNDDGFFWDNYFRIMVIGELCVFTISKTVKTHAGFLPPTSLILFSPLPIGSKDELHTFVLNTNSGKRYLLERSEMDMILKKDPELLNEFKKLSRRKRKKLLFLYIRKYNDKHPLYFPANN